MSFPPNLGITSSLLIDSRGSSLFFQELLPPLDRHISSPFSRTKMNGYSRIKKTNSTRSKSLDFADLSYSKSKFHDNDTKLSNAMKNSVMHNTIPEHEDQEDSGEVFGIILRRRCSNPSAPAQKVMPAQKSSVFMNKSVSIKRSNSASESYFRIHHQSDFTAEDGDDDRKFTSEKKHVKKKGKFIKVCKRVFGF